MINRWIIPGYNCVPPVRKVLATSPLLNWKRLMTHGHTSVDDASELGRLKPTSRRESVHLANRRVIPIIVRIGKANTCIT